MKGRVFVTPSGVTRTVLLIVGMRDNGCREIIVGALEGIKGVHAVDVNLIRARALITHDESCELAEFIRAVVGKQYGASFDGDRGSRGA